MKRILTIVCSLFILNNSLAQEQKKEEEELQTDRPSQTESTELVKKGTTQIETGFLYNYFDNPVDKAAYIGRVLLRYGLLKKLEMRLLVEDGKSRDAYIKRTVQSTYPLALSTKMLLIEKHPWLPDVSLITFLKLPFSSRSKEQTIYWSPAFILAFKNKLSDRWEMEYNAGAMQEAYSTEWNWLGNLSFKYKMNDEIQLFAEYFAQYENGENPLHNAGGGVLYQVSHHLQLDLSGGSSINTDDPNAFGSLGFSYRFK